MQQLEDRVNGIEEREEECCAYKCLNWPTAYRLLTKAEADEDRIVAAKEAEDIEDAQHSENVQAELHKQMLVLPVPKLMAHHRHHFLLFEPLHKRIVEYYPAVAAESIEVGVAMCAAHTAVHKVDVAQWKPHLFGERTNAFPQLARLFELLKVIEERRDEVGVDPGEQQSNHHHEDLDADVEVLAACVGHFEVAVEEGRHDDEHEGCLHDQVVDKQLERLVGVVVLLLNHKGLIEVDGHFEAFGLEGLHNHEAEATLELAFAVHKREQPRNAVPDERHHPAQQHQQVHHELERQHEHFEGQLTEGVLLAPRELLLGNAQPSHLRRHALHEVPLQLPEVYVLLESVLEQEQHCS